MSLARPCVFLCTNTWNVCRLEPTDCIYQSDFSMWECQVVLALSYLAVTVSNYLTTRHTVRHSIFSITIATVWYCVHIHYTVWHSLWCSTCDSWEIYSVTLYKLPITILSAASMDAVSRCYHEMHIRSRGQSRNNSSSHTFDCAW